MASVVEGPLQVAACASYGAQDVWWMIRAEMNIPDPIELPEPERGLSERDIVSWNAFLPVKPACLHRPATPSSTS